MIAETSHSDARELLGIEGGRCSRTSRCLSYPGRAVRALPDPNQRIWASTGHQRFAGIEPSLQTPEDLLAKSVPTLLRFRNIRNWVPLPVSEPFLATIQIELAVDDRPCLGIGSGEFPIDDRSSAKPAEA